MEESDKQHGPGDATSKVHKILGVEGDATDKTLPVSSGSYQPIPKSSTAAAPDTDSDSDSDEEPTNVAYDYGTSEEWKDVNPVPLTAGSVMPIAFTPQFQMVFGYFRALLATGELSARGLQLCEDAARLNPANYAVWMYRRKVLAHLAVDLTGELQYISRVIEKNQKNYQVWYHRQKIVELLKDPSKEFDFTAKMLRKDAKNYHVWQYRQYILRYFDIFDHNELEFCDGLIRADPFNNSAWMHRYYVLVELPRACGRPSLLEGPALEREIQYTVAQLMGQAHNESPWSYLRGILRDHWAEHFPTVQAICSDLYSQNIRSPYLLAFMIDMYDEDIAQGFQATTDIQKGELLARVKAICSDLAVKHDVVRKAYWNYLSQQLAKKYERFLPAV
ncbi:Protein farnesyltransferase/geranylgeranyltransferase type-1 subunit alpha [Hypsibius exemplaris]|uniref:Protein farnesyltransferase/geranylgeranyltransferase type-1 subunit alpha n=1 Tax=Hypsibius exemplaris TaxID=2072580 RepID=A0A1W0WMU8_HYPEX|nr:Protein farnesyltransferase/geranylgeranyltransferase type-1 subunit alpha [Hypsibius exemplaris]